MNCQFCDKKAFAASLCNPHWHRWVRCGRPLHWNGDNYTAWMKSPKNLGIQIVMTSAEALEDYCAFMHDFYDHCQANHLDYMPEIRASIRAHHPNFHPKT